MAKTAKVPQLSQFEETAMEQTYEFEGKVMTQAEMLQVMTPCGHERFVEIDRVNAKISVPYGTLADKFNPLRPIKSLEAQAIEQAHKRHAEGHKIPRTVSRFPVFANASTPGS